MILPRWLTGPPSRAARHRKPTRLLFRAVALLFYLNIAVFIFRRFRTPTLEYHYGIAADEVPTDRLDCNEDFHIPTVALLFLVKSSFPLENVWQEWFQAARCAVPADTLARYARCGERQRHAVTSGLSELRLRCSSDAGGPATAITRAPMFTAYVHSSINHKPCMGFPGGMLDGREVSPRVETDWGQHSVVDAMLLVLRAALKEPRNRRFVFVSESTVPLYPPGLTYLQIMREKRSRVYTCPLTYGTRRVNPGRFYVHDFSDRRWHPGMKTSNFSRQHWRKSPQWVMLTRNHAQLVADDTHVRPLFEKHCSHGDWDAALRRESECVSDEHYIPSLLTSAGLANETNSHALTWVHWRRGEAHPVEFSAIRTTPELMEHIRSGWKGCDASEALLLASAQVVHAFAATPSFLQAAGERDSPWGYDASLLARCPLFARKFVPRAAERLHAALAPCYSGESGGNGGVDAAGACGAASHQALAGLNVFEIIDWRLTNYLLRKPCHL